MNSRLALAAALALPLLVVGPAAASPVTYAFTGELYKPFNGSRRIDGTATFEADQPSSLGGWWAPYYPTDHYVDFREMVNEPADVTVNFDGQTYEFRAELNVHGWVYPPSWLEPNVSPPPQDEIVIFKYLTDAELPRLGSGTASGDFSMAFQTFSATEDLSDLRTLNFAPPTSSVINLLYHSDDYSFDVSGKITSFALIDAPESGGGTTPPIDAPEPGGGATLPIETPEPGAWMIALLAAGAAVPRLRRRT